MTVKSNILKLAALLLISFTITLSSWGAEVSPPKATLTSHTLTTKRITTHYWESGPSNGPLIIFVHGWPEIGLTWRAQMESLGAEGWRCVAPDLRGFGSSSVPNDKNDYKIEEIVKDLIELHKHLGGKAAIWVGHDWGSPIVTSLVSHYPNKSKGIVLVSVPYLPNGWALPNLIIHVDRKLYPYDKYPFGQWDYWSFYLTHFDQALSDMEADIPATLASIFTKGDPLSVGKLSPSALTTQNGGRYGAAHRAPAVAPDDTLWPKDDFNVLVKAFTKTGFRSSNAYYLNDDANISYAKTALDNGKLELPVLYINDEYEPFSNINLSTLGNPMRNACSNLTIMDLPSGHWVTLERKKELTESINLWIKSNGLKK